MWEKVRKHEEEQGRRTVHLGHLQLRQNLTADFDNNKFSRQLMQVTFEMHMSQVRLPLYVSSVTDLDHVQHDS